ncbi:MAG: helix-turn-helix domain-containing protein [Candidatus Omnitrophica bacterium]|nr:helix-turn-helix domain-containing protein [Candidatus Omnitrophota bacterium]
MGNKKKYLSSMDIVRKFKVPYSTLTHYTNLGLLKVVEKEGNKRLYRADKISEKLAGIKKLSLQGYPLKLIKKILNKGGEL